MSCYQYCASTIHVSTSRHVARSLTVCSGSSTVAFWLWTVVLVTVIMCNTGRDLRPRGYLSSFPYGGQCGDFLPGSLCLRSSCSCFCLLPWRCSCLVLFSPTLHVPVTLLTVVHHNLSPSFEHQLLFCLLPVACLDLSLGYDLPLFSSYLCTIAIQWFHNGGADHIQVIPVKGVTPSNREWYPTTMAWPPSVTVHGLATSTDHQN